MKIRERLDVLEAGQEYGNEQTISLLIEMARCLLDWHSCDAESGIKGEIHCGELHDWYDGGCPTLRIIADKLGIT